MGRSCVFSGPHNGHKLLKYIILSPTWSFFSMTKHDNRANVRISFYMWELYSSQYNKFCIPFTTTLMQRHRFQKPPLCLWRGKNVHTKPQNTELRVNFGHGF